MTSPTGRQVTVLTAEMARYTYKPGYRLSLGSDQFLSPMVYFHLEAVVPDSRNPDRVTMLRFTEPVPPHIVTHPEQFEQWLQTVLGQFEQHELAEWLRRDGQLIADPHAERRHGRPA